MAISPASLNRATALKPPRILIHGVHAVGETTFAAGAPEPVFILTEDGLGTLDVPHFQLARTFDEVMQALAALYAEEHRFRTLVMDSADWLEPLVWARVCKDQGWKSIEDAGYGIPNTDPPRVRIISEDPLYSPYEGTAEEVNIIGRIRWFARET